MWIWIFEPIIRVSIIYIYTKVFDIDWFCKFRRNWIATLLEMRVSRVVGWIAWDSWEYLIYVRFKKNFHEWSIKILESQAMVEGVRISFLSINHSPLPSLLNLMGKLWWNCSTIQRRTLQSWGMSSTRLKSWQVTWIPRQFCFIWHEWKLCGA